jgi:hypothetical protein
MPNRQAFGRRINPQAVNRPQPTASQPVAPCETVTAVVDPMELAAPTPNTAENQSPDMEPRAWKQARDSRFKMPWSQLSLMASLCFGIASFVLPDSVNESVDWLLWALAIMSFGVWFSDRRKKKLKVPAAP